MALQTLYLRLIWWSLFGLTRWLTSFSLIYLRKQILWENWCTLGFHSAAVYPMRLSWHSSGNNLRPVVLDGKEGEGGLEDGVRMIWGRTTTHPFFPACSPPTWRNLLATSKPVRVLLSLFKPIFILLDVEGEDRRVKKEEEVEVHPHPFCVGPLLSFPLLGVAGDGPPRRCLTLFRWPHGWRLRKSPSSFFALFYSRHFVHFLRSILAQQADTDNT